MVKYAINVPQESLMELEENRAKIVPKVVIKVDKVTQVVFRAKSGVISLSQRATHHVIYAHLILQLIKKNLSAKPIVRVVETVIKRTLEMEIFVACVWMAMVKANLTVQNVAFVLRVKKVLKTTIAN
jgi:hypothetical protein